MSLHATSQSLWNACVSLPNLITANNVSCVQVGPARSVDQAPPPHSHDHKPTPLAPRPESSVSSDKSGGRGVGVARGRLPPPRPPPYIPQLAERNQKIPSG